MKAQGENPPDFRSRGSSWILVLLLTGAFAPLVAGYNFLPLERYPSWTRGLTESMGAGGTSDEGFLQRQEENPWLREVDPSWFTLQIPRSLFTAEKVHAGVLPLWDPFTGCGVPTFASGHYRPFDPFKLPFLVVPGLWTYAFSLFLGLLFGAWGAWRWLRSENLSPEACALGTAVFALNPWSLERIVLQDASAYYILPWCILGLRGARWGDWRSAARAAVPLVFMGHVGHPEACIVLTAVAALCALGCGERRAPLGKAGVLALAAVAVVLCLAILWLPPLELFRSGFSYKKFPVVFEYPYAWKALITPASDLFVLPVLAGLAACGLVWGKRIGLWALLAAASLLLLMPLPGLGHRGADALQRYAGVPVFYLKPVLWAALALLAARGWDALRDGGPRRAALAAAAATALAAASAAFVLRLGPLPPAELAAFPALTLALSGAGALALPLAARTSRRATALALLLAVLAPLAFPLPLNQLDWNRLRLGTHEAAAWMRRQAPHARAVSIAFRPSFVVPPNWGQALGVRTGEENAVLFPNRFLELYRKAKFPMTLVIFDYPEFEAFRQLGASVILLPNAAPALGVPQLFRGSWASAFAVPHSSGRLFFAARAAPLDPRRDLSTQIVELGAGSDAVAVVDDPAGGSTPDLPPAAPDGAEARFVEDGVHAVTVATRAQAPGLLVLKDTWYRGWRASVDGRPAPIYRVNGCFRGVPVPAGEHSVRFLYRPGSLYAAAAVSLLATLLVIALAMKRKTLSSSREAGVP